MRLVKSSATTMLALALGLLGAQQARTQAKPPAKAAAKAAAAAPQPKAAPAAPQTKAAPPAAKSQAAPAAPKSKAAPAPPRAKAAPAAPKPKAPAPKGKAKVVEAKVAAPAAPSRRDPFDPLVSRKGGSEIPEKLPPGKAGLVVAGIRVDGLVRAPSGMIAVVSNQQRRVYFLREGDRLYNGEVLKITAEAVTFRESGKDAFGRPVDRTLTKRLYPSAGEQR